MGGVPNRQGGRRRRNTTTATGGQYVPDTIQVGDVDWDETERDGEITPAPDPDPEWHPVAANLYDAMRRSGQRVYYEPSDWALAQILCEQITRELNPKFVGFKKVQDGETVSGLPVMVDEEHFETVPLVGGSLNALLKAMEKLMVTEVDRRRARIEIDRGAVLEDDSMADNVVQMRSHLLGGA